MITLATSIHNKRSFSARHVSHMAVVETVDAPFADGKWALRLIMSNGSWVHYWADSKEAAERLYDEAFHAINRWEMTYGG